MGVATGTKERNSDIKHLLIEICPLDQTACREADDNNKKLYSSVLERAMQDLICLCDERFGLDRNDPSLPKLPFQKLSCPEMKDIEFDTVLKWFKSTSQEEKSFHWVCEKIGHVPEKCLTAFGKILSDRYNEEIL